MGLDVVVDRCAGVAAHAEAGAIVDPFERPHVVRHELVEVDVFGLGLGQDVPVADGAVEQVLLKLLGVGDDLIEDDRLA